MEHKGTLNLQTERLLLRRFHLNDAEMMYHNWANDERVTKFLTWTPYKSIDDVKHFISSTVILIIGSSYLTAGPLAAYPSLLLTKETIFANLVIV